MYNYGLIGVSSIVQRFVDGMKESPGCKAYAISSRSLDKAKDFAKKNAIPKYFGDYHQLLACKEVNIVYVSTTNITHFAIAYDALQAGKHVIVEKPFTANYQQAVDLVNLAQKKKLFLMEGQKALFLATTAKIKELVDKDVLGRIVYVYLPASDNYDFADRTWMKSYAEAGGALMGSSSYALSFVSYITSSTIKKAHSLEIHHPNQADSLTSLSFQTETGTICNTILGSEIKTVNRCYVHGTKGYVVLDSFWKSKAMTLVLNDEVPQDFVFPYSSEFTFYLDHVNEQLKEKSIESPIMTHALTLQSMKYMDQFLNEYIANQ